MKPEDKVKLFYMANLYYMAGGNLPKKKYANGSMVMPNQMQPQMPMMQGPQADLSTTKQLTSIGLNPSIMGATGGLSAAIAPIAGLAIDAWKFNRAMDNSYDVNAMMGEAVKKQQRQASPYNTETGYMQGNFANGGSLPEDPPSGGGWYKEKKGAKVFQSGTKDSPPSGEGWIWMDSNPDAPPAEDPSIPAEKSFYDYAKNYSSQTFSDDTPQWNISGTKDPDALRVDTLYQQPGTGVTTKQQASDITNSLLVMGNTTPDFNPYVSANYDYALQQYQNTASGSGTGKAIESNNAGSIPDEVGSSVGSDFLPMNIDGKYRKPLYATNPQAFFDQQYGNFANGGKVPIWKMLGDNPSQFQMDENNNQQGGGESEAYKEGGLSRSKDYGSEKKPYPMVKGKDFAGGDRSYPIPTKADAVDALRLAGLHGRSDVKAKVYAKYPELKNNDRLRGGPINTEPIPPNPNLRLQPAGQNPSPSGVYPYGFTFFIDKKFDVYGGGAGIAGYKNVGNNTALTGSAELTGVHTPYGSNVTPQFNVGITKRFNNGGPSSMMDTLSNDDYGIIPGNGNPTADDKNLLAEDGAFIVPANRVPLAQQMLMESGYDPYQELETMTPGAKQGGTPIRISSKEMYLSPDVKKDLQLDMGMTEHDWEKTLSPNSPHNRYYKGDYMSENETSEWDSQGTNQYVNKQHNVMNKQKLSPTLFAMGRFENGGYTVKRSNDREGKTHVVIGPDGTKKYFGDSNLGQHPDDPERKKAFYARHRENLQNNPYFKAYAEKTWADGGPTNDEYAKGGEMIKRADGSYSRRGLWDNMRANKGSGKEPTKEMLEQERKIKAKEGHADGGIADWWYNNMRSQQYRDENYSPSEMKAMRKEEEAQLNDPDYSSEREINMRNNQQPTAETPETSTTTGLPEDFKKMNRNLLIANTVGAGGQALYNMMQKYTPMPRPQMYRPEKYTADFGALDEFMNRQIQKVGATSRYNARNVNQIPATNAAIQANQLENQIDRAAKMQQMQNELNYRNTELANQANLLNLQNIQNVNLQDAENRFKFRAMKGQALSGNIESGLKGYRNYVNADFGMKALEQGYKAGQINEQLYRKALNTPDQLTPEEVKRINAITGGNFDPSKLVTPIQENGVIPGTI